MRNRRGGFTLIELLVAITILAIVAVLGWRGLDTIVRARVALNSDLEETRGLQLAFAQMQSDCTHIMDADSIGRHPTLMAEAGRLTLVRTVFAENQPSRVQVVDYRLRDGVLSRRESNATRDLRQLDNDWKAALGDRDIGPAVTMQTDVERMPIRLWSRNGPQIANGAPVQVSSATNPATSFVPGSGATPAQPAGTPSPTGVEVMLQVKGRTMVKLFLLGAA